MIGAIFKLLDFRIQRAAKRNIKFLEAAADRQQRYGRLDRLADQIEGRGVAVVVVGLVAGRRIVAIMAGMNIAARACRQHAVDAAENGIKVDIAGKTGQDERRCANARQRFEIDIDSRVQGILIDLANVGGDKNDGIHDVVCLSMTYTVIG